MSYNDLKYFVKRRSGFLGLAAFIGVCAMSSQSPDDPIEYSVEQARYGTAYEKISTVYISRIGKSRYYITEKPESRVFFSVQAKTKGATEGLYSEAYEKPTIFTGPNGVLKSGDTAVTTINPNEPILLTVNPDAGILKIKLPSGRERWFHSDGKITKPPQNNNGPQAGL